VSQCLRRHHHHHYQQDHHDDQPDHHQQQQRQQDKKYHHQQHQQKQLSNQHNLDYSTTFIPTSTSTINGHNYSHNDNKDEEYYFPLLTLFYLQKYRVLSRINDGGKIPRAIQCHGDGLGSWKSLTDAIDDNDDDR